jgi:transposase
MRHERADHAMGCHDADAPNKPRGVRRAMTADVLNSDFWRSRSEAPWRDLPACARHHMLL